jgi:hypothetical protein
MVGPFGAGEGHTLAGLPMPLLIRLRFAAARQDSYFIFGIVVLQIFQPYGLCLQAHGEWFV